MASQSSSPPFSPSSIKGFTIVELLIVIVVIAILAAITVVAYNGMQQRARNTATLNAAEAYKKALIMYATAAGSYPTGSFCLGIGYPSGKCWAGLGESASSMDALKPYLGNNFPMPGYMGTDTHAGGVVFAGNYTIDGTAGHNTMRYALEGSSSMCSVGPTFTYKSGNLSTSAPNDRPGGSFPQCFVLLPDV